MAKKAKLKLYATSLAAATLLAACGGTATDSTESTSNANSGNTEASDNILDVQFDVEVASLDPQIGTDGAGGEIGRASCRERV